MTLAARCRGSPEGCFESGVTTAGGRGAADGLVSGVLFAARRQVASSPSGTGWQAGQRAPARRYRRSTWNLGVHMPGARKRRLGSQKAHDPEELVMSYRRCIQHPGPETPLQWPGLWSEEDVSSPQGSVCDGLPRIRDSKHCRPPDRSIREPSNPSLGAPGRYRSSVPEGCGAGDGLASGGLLAARRTTHSSSHQTRAGKRAKAVAERGYRCIHVEPARAWLGAPSSCLGLGEVFQAGTGAELGAQLRVRRIRGSAPLTKLLCAFPGLASKGDRRRSPSAIDGLRKAVSNQAWWCPRVAVRRPGGTRPPANSGGAACPGPDARSSRSRS